MKAQATNRSMKAKIRSFPLFVKVCLMNTLDKLAIFERGRSGVPKDDWIPTTGQEEDH